MAASPSGDIYRVSEGQRTGIENPALYKAPEVTAPTKPIAKAEKTAVQKLIDSLKEETKQDGPNFADFIEAAASGWQGKRAAYLEKQAAAAERQQKLEELARTAELETELRAADIAAAKERALITAGVNPELFGLKGIGGVGGVSRGTAFGMTAPFLGGD
jgi:hypothetical protein